MVDKWLPRGVADWKSQWLGIGWLVKLGDDQEVSGGAKGLKSPRDGRGLRLGSSRADPKVKISVQVVDLGSDPRKYGRTVDL